MIVAEVLRRGGTDELLARIDDLAGHDALQPPGDPNWQAPTTSELRARQREADRIIKAAVKLPPSPIGS